MFQDLIRILGGHLIVHFCKVTDPASTGKNTNLTTNYFVEQVRWPDEVLWKLKDANGRMMKFRDLIVDARNRRLAHVDLKAQVVTLGNLGKFPKGDDVAHEHLFGEPHPIEASGATDAGNLIRALGKAAVFDTCHKCTELERINAILDFEGSNGAYEL